MTCFKKLCLLLFLFLPFFFWGQVIPNCNSVTISSATNNGNYLVDSYLENDGIRDGVHYYGATIYYPQNNPGLLPAIIIIPGYANPELSIQTWGPFLASHGVVCMTIGTNSLFDEVYERKTALEDALISLKEEWGRLGSPLFNILDTNLIAFGGWSMGGGGAQLAAVGNPNIKAVLAFCPWIDPLDLTSALLNHNIPTLFFSGQVDVVAPPGIHASAQYYNTPSSTNKLLYEVFAGGHTIANSPLGGFGEVGRMGLSWLKKYLVNDSCYCPLLLDIPSTASDYITNINCSDVIPSWDCVDGFCIDLGVGNGVYPTLSSCLIDSCWETTGSFNYTISVLSYPNPAENFIGIRGLSNNSPYNIISVDGQVLLSGFLNTNSKINISKLKAGGYFFVSAYQKIYFIKA